MTGDEARLAEYAEGLVDQLVVDVPSWVERSVASRSDQDLGEAARRAGEEAGRAVELELRALLRLDIDEQRSTPLEVLRAAVAYPTRVLASAGVPAPERDEFSRHAFPDDAYGLAPASLADISPEAQEAGILWGAAKAYVHLDRRSGDRRR